LGQFRRLWSQESEIHKKYPENKHKAGGLISVHKIDQEHKELLFAKNGRKNTFYSL
jgi:hypothetical protein